MFNFQESVTLENKSVIQKQRNGNDACSVSGRPREGLGGRGVQDGDKSLLLNKTTKQTNTNATENIHFFLILFRMSDYEGFK